MGAPGDNKVSADRGTYPCSTPDVGMDDRREGPSGDSAGEHPPSGFVSIRRALTGLGLIWLTAVAGVGALIAAVYGATVSSPYLLAAGVAAVVAVSAGAASLRAFGYR